MITQKQKRVIYGQLISSFEREVDIPLASLALFLNSKHISYSELGYKKIKPFLNSLEFLSLKTKENKRLQSPKGKNKKKTVIMMKNRKEGIKNEIKQIKPKENKF